MRIASLDEIIETNDQTEAREQNLKALTELVGNPYPNKFERSQITGGEDTISALVEFESVARITGEIEKILEDLGEGERPAPEIKEPLNEKLRALGNVRIAGRLATPPRVMGKAAFVHLSDGKNRLQIYVRKQDAKAISNDTGEILEEGNTGFSLFKNLDHGDFVGVEGFLFLTNTGELSVHVEKIQFLAKAMLPMPDKMHGISDPELRRRYRYADLIGSSLQVEHEGLTTREVFERRAKIISSMRRYLEDHGYIEVETPMLTPKATGAAAEPFETHHNALDIKLYARIAPELYLKRLMVGGFEKVFELNRNFRNEGISYKHNPEFTMLEFYCAYMDVNGMMDFCEKMLKKSVEDAAGGLKIKFEENEIDFSKFERLSMKEAIFRSLEPANSDISFSDYLGERFDISWLDSPQSLQKLVKFFHKCLKLSQPQGEGKLVVETKLIIETKEESEERRRQIIEQYRELWREATAEIESSQSVVNQKEEAARNLVYIFEEVVEQELIQPTFIVDYPKIISPLSKASPENPQIAERFELFINGMECANGFSELNSPKEQYERFVDQMKEREGGDAEAMVLDEDYIRALSYGMPPAAGIGIGIDRIVMLLTNQHSIRDVILFPHMRPEKNTLADEEE